jgi:hypothetical protein
METEVVTQYGVLTIRYYCDDVGMKQITAVIDSQGSYIDVPPELLTDILRCLEDK